MGPGVSESVRGMSFGVEDHTFLEIAVANADPFAPLREVLQNSFEAGASEIDIFESSGKIVVRDNGCGMSAKALKSSFSKYGQGSKQRGVRQNMGIGMKAVASIISGRVVVTSWVTSAQAFQVILGRIKPGDYGMLFHRGTEEIVREVAVPRDRGSKPTDSGTQVELSGMDFEPYRILRYINSHWLRLPATVRVWRRHRADELRPETALGSLQAMSQICENSGQLKLRHCNLYWGIRRKAKNPEEDAALTHFSTHFYTGDPLSLAWDPNADDAVGPEIFRSWSLQRKGTTMLNRYGIRAGGKGLIFIIEAKGDKIAPTPDRCGITGWDEEDAQEEVIDRLPEEILAYMDGFEAEHFDTQAEKALVQRLIQALGTSSSMVEGHPSGIIPTGGGGGGGGGGNSSGGRDRGRSSGTTTRARGIVGYSFVDKDQLGTDPVAYNRLSHEIQINRDHGLIKPLIGRPKNAKEKLTVRGLLAFHMIQGFQTLLKARNNETPTDEQLEALICCPSLAMMRSLNPNSVHVPRFKAGELDE